jgi:hypothetical protein
MESRILRNVSPKPRLVGGIKGHTMNETSSARILLAPVCPGSPPCLPRPNGVEESLTYEGRNGDIKGQNEK